MCWRWRQKLLCAVELVSQGFFKLVWLPTLGPQILSFILEYLVLITDSEKGRSLCSTCEGCDEQGQKLKGKYNLCLS